MVRDARSLSSGRALRGPVGAPHHEGLTDLPDGLIFRNRVNSHLQKYSDLQKSKPVYGSPIPPGQEGRFAIVTNVGWGAMDVQAQLTNAADTDGEGVWS
jgi:hypothetical protein